MRRVLAAAAPLALAAALLRRRMLVVTVRGVSMAPALRPGDRLVVRRDPGAVRPGDVVVVRLDPGRAGYAIKRVAAVAGDPRPAYLPGTGARVPAGHLVLLGDNAAVSLDSRQLGPVPADRLVGVVRRRLPAGSAGRAPEPGGDLGGLGRAQLLEEGLRPPERLGRGGGRALG